MQYSIYQAIVRKLYQEKPFFQKRLSNNEYIWGSKYLPGISHFGPLKPGLQSHAPSVQVPPFLHGFGLHGSLENLSNDKKMFTKLP